MLKGKEKKLEAKRQKELDLQIERKMIIKNTIKKMNNLLTKYKEKQNELIVLAAKAKKEGRMRDFNQFIPPIKMYMARTLKTQSMLDKLQMAQIMHDDADLTADFASAMEVLAEETSRLYNSDKLKGVAEKFRKTNIESQKNKVLFDRFMEEINEEFENMNDSDNVEIDDELNERIEEQMDGINSTIDDQIREAMKDFK